MPLLQYLPAVRVRVPAKVNLHLGVGPARPDGYHELRTVFQAVDLVDEIVAFPARHLEISVSGPEADGVPSDARNLAWRAASLLAERAEVAPHVRLEITKSIPVAGGMAGGSADAAAALLACAELWQTHSSRQDLTELAAELGSDVAFGLLGGTALGTGRGEILAPVLATGKFWWVFAFADFGISTPAAYAELDRQRDAVIPETDLDGRRCSTRYAPVTHGPLRPSCTTTCRPRRSRSRLRCGARSTPGAELGALAAIVSGSGPTCAFLTLDRDDATRLAAALAGEGVCRTVRVACGPTAGARIVR